MLNIKGFRRLIFGDNVDENDPKLKKSYEDAKSAGEKFSRLTGIAYVGGHIVAWSEKHKVVFFSIILTLMVFMAAANCYRFIHEGCSPLSGSAVKQQEKAIREIKNAAREDIGGIDPDNAVTNADDALDFQTK